MRKIKEKSYYPFLVFTIAITVFYFIFDKLILKSDDGHFISIMSETSFNLSDWLRYRYENISGRTVCEFLTMGFLSVNTFYWKLFSSLIWITVIYILIKIISAFGEYNYQNTLFVCCLPFSIFITCLNPGAFWFSGEFTYFIPFSFMTIALSPIIFELLEIKFNRIILGFISPICAIVACSQEQSSALTVSFCIVLSCLLIRNKRLKFYHVISFIAAVAETYFLFSSPGMKKRIALEASAFENFKNLSFFDKIVCGFSNFFAYEFLISVFVSGLFTVLVFLSLQNLYPNYKKTLKISAGILILVCGILNILYSILNKMIPDKGFEHMFKSGIGNVFDYVLILFGVVYILILTIALVLITIKNKKIGFASLLCFAASVCSGVVLGFSSSIYSSGQRVFFFSEILLMISNAIMYAGITNESKRKKILNAVTFVSIITFAVDCFTFMFLETPIMG